MKVRSLIDQSSRPRVLVAAALALALAGGISPLAASAATAPVPVTAPVAAPVPVAASVAATVAAAATSTVPSSITTPAPRVVAPAPKKRSVRDTIVYVGRRSGLSAVELNALLWIAKHESNFHPTSKSHSGCYGLFQLSSKMSAGHPWKDPVWNTSRAIKYMRGRYHGVLNAKSFWQSHHWY